LSILYLANLKSNPKPDKIRIVTLGCSKNLVDSEILMKQLDNHQVELISETSPDPANTVIINTCGFIQDAKEESIDTILHYVGEKEKGEIQNLYVIGCLSERYRDELRSEIPEVDRYFGVNDFKAIIKNFDLEYRDELIGERYLSTPGHYAYLKISEGCNWECSFCAIPLIRGKHISKPIEELVHEAENLGKQGVKELILIAQDLTYYGLDIYNQQRLKDLLTELTRIKNIGWIRLHYAYPSRFPMDILPLIKENEKICSYLDIPLQHINDTVLKLMRRGNTKKEILDLLSVIRREVPGIALRTTLLTGHPGETEQDFEELERFVADTRFDRLGVFTYSHEEDTYGYNHYSDDIPESVKINRKDRLMQLQQNISNELNNNKIGNSFKVIVDRREGDYFVGRTEHDSPEVDNEVLIKREKQELQTGGFYTVRITEAGEFDLFGVVV